MTKVMAKEILDLWKGHSRLHTLTMAELESILTAPNFCGDCPISQADAIVIEMALVLAGIKIPD